MNARRIASRIVKSADDGTLRKTLEWIGNLERAFGQDAVLDQLPNDFGGRNAIQSLLESGADPGDESALLRAAKYTLENLDAAARDNLISATKATQAQLGESARMLREAIRGRSGELASPALPEPNTEADRGLAVWESDAASAEAAGNNELASQIRRNIQDHRGQLSR